MCLSVKPAIKRLVAVKRVTRFRVTVVCSAVRLVTEYLATDVCLAVKRISEFFVKVMGLAVKLVLEYLVVLMCLAVCAPRCTWPWSPRSTLPQSCVAR